MRLEDFYRQLEVEPPALILLYGEEDYLLNQAHQRIRSAIFGTTRDDFNDHQFHAKSARVEEILDAASTYPVFASRKLVTVKDVQLLAAADQDKFSAYLEHPLEQTCLLMIADKIDSRRKFFQLFKKKGVVLKFDPLTDRELPDVVRRAMQQRGISISRDGLDLFCSLVSNSLHEIEGELDKLVLYLGSRRDIGVDDVEAIISRGRSENVFVLGEAIAKGDLVRALTLVRRFAAASEPPLLVLNLITGHYRLLWKIRALDNQRCAAAEIARQVARPPFVVQRLLEQARRFSRRHFMAAYALFIETDLAMKSSGGDAGALLELMVIRLMRDK
ncbi:DNA polymerase III subunit delta [Pelovirga terrestris]|uniref:DNA polymerase III subunit delta n=1 Tax=Pelovirga terrestris TaxID=2771352 RepID=A0A8J6QWD5_9BACT|nr:DNA polymerase III subunit delta [Pelovirga terrestris]MBD1399588.1 DNA polymerase III subunit delta [Pelovirga terrestris]